jgi:hypothetical protein
MSQPGPPITQAGKARKVPVIVGRADDGGVGVRQGGWLAHLIPPLPAP